MPLGRLVFVRLFVICGALAACTADGQAPVATDDRQTASPAAPADPSPAAPAPPVEPTVTARLTPPAEPAPVPQAAAPPPKPPPIELVGMAGDRVVDALGRPHHVWREPPAAVWQYRVTDCVVHVFFYPTAGDGLRVVHVTRRQTGGSAKSANGAVQPAPTEYSDKLCRRVELAR